MTVNVESIKALRELSGAGVMDCRTALEDSGGDIEEAHKLLRTKGFEAATKRSEKTTNEGIIEAYIHGGGRIGAIVELNCETDFVARTDEFRSLAHDLAMQVAAMSPQYISPDQFGDDDSLTPAQDSLLYQPFIKDQSRTINDLINDARGKIGENIQVKRFVRFALGEE